MKLDTYRCDRSNEDGAGLKQAACAAEMRLDGDAQIIPAAWATKAFSAYIKRNFFKAKEFSSFRRMISER